MKTVRKILRRYVISLTVILCLGLSLIGIVTAKERTEYNAYMTPYPTLSVENNKESLNIKAGDKEIEIKKPPKELLSDELREVYKLFYRLFE